MLYPFNININIYWIFFFKNKGRDIIYLRQVDNKEEPGARERVVKLVIVLPMPALDHLEYLLIDTNKIYDNNNNTHLKSPVWYI